MKKVLSLILVLALTILSSAAALADGLLQFDLEIVNEQPASHDAPKPEAPKPQKTEAPSNSTGSASDDVSFNVPTVVEPSSGSGSSSNAGSSGSSNGSSSESHNTPAPAATQAPQTPHEPSVTLSPADQLLANAGALNSDSSASSGNEGGNNATHEVILDNPTPTTDGSQNVINDNVPQINLGPAIDAGIINPIQDGIEENEITDFELNGDAMHSLRIRASIAPGSVVNVGDRVELTAIPMGFAGVNFKIQWQMAEVQADGSLSEFHNIPGAFGAKYVIVFDERNINNHWRAAIKIVD